MNGKQNTKNTFKKNCEKISNIPLIILFNNDDMREVFVSVNVLRISFIAFNLTRRYPWQ